MKVYLCGPINGCTDEECKDWREFVKQRLSDTLDPMCRDYRGREAECYVEIVEGDKEDIDTADVLLVNYDKPSVGTSMEILYAWNQGIPVVVACKPETSISPWLRYHSTKMVHSFDDAIKWIEAL
jgi:nucleoside 2-deoxyribosyltransferase